ncbi:hypothetical protein KSP40_PGU009202 [Platanthera guangdongensis]|uniref:CP-type G domain-containing protein n=1 Tax=Platanthera guangdongensis TaxID=2320717 RepID=A0ABR2LG79_9ASPA
MAETLSSYSATPTKLQLFSHGASMYKREFFVSFRLNVYSPLSPSMPLSSSSIYSISHRKTPLLCFPSHTIPTPTKPSFHKTPVVSEGRENDEARLICPGCGVFMQNSDPNLPGFYQKPSVSVQDGDYSDHFPSESDEFFEELDEDDEPSLKLDSEVDEISDGEDSGIDWDSDWGLEEDEESKYKKELDGFSLPGVGYGNITPETLTKLKKDKISKAEKKRKMREAKRDESECSITVCARCHSLRNYGQIKNQKAENLIPDFDFDRFISAKLIKPSTSAPVVIIVVDCVDFDGSFPKRAAKSLFKALELSTNSSRMNKLPKLVLVATKVDLLPQQISPARLDRWVRRRAKAIGAPKLNAVYLVSALKDLGVKNLLSFIKELAGPRGNVWVIGAQNAGKSTLINTLAKKEGVKVMRLTEAAVPGTTLGILRIAGILPAKAKLYDTPGLLHPYLMTMRLNREEQKMVEIRKELQPRTFRIKAEEMEKMMEEAATELREKQALAQEGSADRESRGVEEMMVVEEAAEEEALTQGERAAEDWEELSRLEPEEVGQTVHVGGLMRLDLTQCSVETIYVTVWASPSISLHLGKIDTADELRSKHFGVRLQPPIGQDRATELGEWRAREFNVSGTSWDVNSVDISASGLGWFSLGLKCQATVIIWTFEGVELAEREPLVLDRAPFLERPGFLLPKVVSDALGNQAKMEAEARKKKLDEEDLYLDARL